jgi:microcystin-dependent protein
MPKFAAPLTLPVRTSDPSLTAVAAMYYNSSTGVIRTRGNSGWQNANTASAAYSGSVGMVTMWIGGSTPPTGWLICDGSAVNTYTYKTLHALISNNFGGTAYSAGVTDQSGVATTFNLPDYRGRMLVGASAALTGAADDTTSTWFTGATSPLSAFAHSTDGSHSAHVLTQTTGGGHSHTASHSHTTTTGTPGNVTMTNHTASGAFGNGGAAHTHSVTSGFEPVVGTIATITGSVTIASQGGHQHVVTLASAGSSTNHVSGSDSYTLTPGGSGTHNHGAAAGSASSSSDDVGSSTVAGHTHTVSAQGAGGSHAHTSHSPKIQAVHFIVRV